MNRFLIIPLLLIALGACGMLIRRYIAAWLLVFILLGAPIIRMNRRLWERRRRSLPTAHYQFQFSDSSILLAEQTLLSYLRWILPPVYLKHNDDQTRYQNRCSR